MDILVTNVNKSVVVRMVIVITLLVAVHVILVGLDEIARNVWMSVLFIQIKQKPQYICQLGLCHSFFISRFPYRTSTFITVKSFIFDGTNFQD